MSSSSWLNCSLHTCNASFATNCEPWRMLEAKSDPKSSQFLCHSKSLGTDGLKFTLKMPNKCLVSYIALWSGGVREVDVWVGNSPNLVLLKSSVRLAANRLNEIPLGHIPCQYVQIRCTRGTTMSIYQIRLNGIETDRVGTVMGPSTEYLLYRATEDLLYGKSLRLTRPISKGSKAMKKVGGDVTDKSYSYMTNLTTPGSVVMGGKGLDVEGLNMHGKKLEEALNNLSGIARTGVPESPDVYAILPKGVGGRGKMRGTPPMMGVDAGEVVMVF